MRDDEAVAHPLRERVGEIELAAPHVDGVGGDRTQALRGARRATAVEVDDRPLAFGIEQDQRARALARDPHHEPGVDARRLERPEQPLADRIRSHRGHEQDVVPGVAERNRGVGAAATQPQLALARVEMATLASGWCSQTTSSCATDPTTTMRAMAPLPRGSYQRAPAVSHSAREGTRPLSWA